MQFCLVLLQTVAVSALAIAPRGETLNKREDWAGEGNVEIYVSDASTSPK